MRNLAWILVFFSAIRLKVNEASNTETSVRSCTQVVLVGATGDLAKKYLWKGLFELYRKHTKLDEILQIYGAAREDFNKGQRHIQEVLSSKIKCDSKDNFDCEKWKGEFLQNTKYHKLKKDEDYVTFCKGLDSNGAEKLGRIFYLSVPPFAYSSISKSIHKHCRPTISNGKSFLRVVLEKPFGSDLESAKSLAKEIEQYFAEEEIYRVDHYLGKTGVSQILNFRIQHQENYSRLWNRDHIKSIEIGLKEKDDCKGRTEFYNQYGVIRDVMQNHMTELMALVSMDIPISINNTSDTHRRKLQFLNEIEPLHQHSALIGQYSSYKKHCKDEQQTTNPVDIKTPTFAAVLLHSKNSKWNEVPFIMVSGKQLSERTAYVRITFNSEFNISPQNPQTSCPLKQLIFHIQGGVLKKPALIISKSLPKVSKFSNWVPMETKPDYLYDCPGNSYDIFEPPVSKDAYTALIDAVYVGKKEQFIGTSDLLASWRIWSPLVNSLKSVAPVIYSRKKLEILDFKISGKRLDFINEISCASNEVCQQEQEQTFNHYLQTSFRGSDLVTGSTSSVVKKLAMDILNKALETVSTRGVFHMALSGGSTPLNLFEQLAFFTAEFPWHATHVWFADERCYSYTDKRSNFNFIYQHLLKYIPIPITNVHQMPVHMKNGLCSPLDYGAEHYKAKLKSFISNSLALDYVLLGVGTDGHIASLFPNNNFQSTKNWVVISESKLMNPIGLRMTLTLEVFNKAKAVGILILGEKKAGIVSEIGRLKDKEIKEQLPVSSLNLDNGEIIWYIDDKALKT